MKQKVYNDIMEIKQPKQLSDGELLRERVMVSREMARLTVYLCAINEERVARCPEDCDAEVIPLFR